MLPWTLRMLLVVIDAYWQREINYWDIAAGIIILKEAGGFVEFFENETDGSFKRIFWPQILKFMRK